MHCNTLQHTTTRCNTLQHTTLQDTPICDALQHTATHYNTLQHAAIHCNTRHYKTNQYAMHCNTLQHTATHCNTPQHTTLHDTPICDANIGTLACTAAESSRVELFWSCPSSAVSEATSFLWLSQSSSLSRSVYHPYFIMCLHVYLYMYEQGDQLRIHIWWTNSWWINCRHDPSMGWLRLVGSLQL